MNKPINRTTVQTGENKYKMYPKASPLFYKKSDGSYEEIDHTFRDTKSAVGDISLMDKGILSVGRRKGNNPYKIVGIRPDTNQHLGTEQLEFSLINVELDNEKQILNLEEDFDVKVRISKVFQFIKIKKHFQNIKVEFDIHLKNIEIMNPKYESPVTLYDYDFKLTNIGDNNGSTTLGMYNSYSSEDRDIPHLDCFVGKITDEFITTGEYSNEEEFGDNDLSEYTLEKMYLGGSSVYLKDNIIFAVKPSNIENFEDIIVNQICDLYGLETIYEENKNGKYFTKDKKKIGGFYSISDTFFAFFNTTEISDKVKTLFKRKSFEDTSFLDITLDEFYEDIKGRLDKDLTIEVDENYYQSINSSFYFKVGNENIKIGLPLAVDENYNDLNYWTTHTLMDNKDGTFRYTKLMQPIGALYVNKAKYFDTALAIGNTEDCSLGYAFSTSGTSSTLYNKTSANLTIMRNATTATSFVGMEYTAGLVTITSEAFIQGWGESARRQSTTGSQGGATTYDRNWLQFQSSYFFDSTSITDDVTDLKFKFQEWIIDSGGGVTPGINAIILKSTYDGATPNLDSTTPPAGHLDDWNELEGFTSGWDSSDVTEYSSEVFLDEQSSVDIADLDILTFASDEISMNATSKTDIKANDSFAITILESECYYADDSNAGVTDVFGLNETRYTLLYTKQVDNIDVAERPYLEVTTGTVSTPTDNTTFFGTNF